MMIGYIRLSRSGPTREEQEEALAGAGVDLDRDHSLYVDPMPKPNKVATYEQRLEAIRALREGDLLVIHSAPRLGSIEAEILQAAADIAAKGAAIHDCAANAEVRYHPDAAKMMAWAKAGAALAAQERLAKSRKSIRKQYIPPAALPPAKMKRAKALWADRTRTVKSIAAELEVSARTLYRHMPKRNP